MSAPMFPLELTIPLPRTIEKGKGITSTQGPYKCFIQYRGIIPERERLAKAAALLGLSYGAFMRCVVNDAADAIIKHFEEYEASQINQPGND